MDSIFYWLLNLFKPNLKSPLEIALYHIKRHKHIYGTQNVYTFATTPSDYCVIYMGKNVIMVRPYGKEKDCFTFSLPEDKNMIIKAINEHVSQ